METTKRHLREVMKRVDQLQWQQLTTYDDARYLVRALREVQAELDTLKAAIEKAIADTRSDAALSKERVRSELYNVAHRFDAALAACVPPQANNPTNTGEPT